MCGLLFARCMSLLWGKADMPSRFGATVVAVITQRRKQDDASLLRNARFLRTPIFFGLASTAGAAGLIFLVLECRPDNTNN
jgi:hypothetical protein